MDQRWEIIDSYLRTRGVRIGPPRPEQTTSGTHSPTSLHYKGLARDYGNVDSDVTQVAYELFPFARGANFLLCELFHSPTNTFYKNGMRITPSKSLRASHQNHVHAALRPGATLPVAKPQTLTEASTMTQAKAVAIMSSPTGDGFAIVSDVGGVYAFGDFQFRGSLGGPLAAPIVDAVAVPDGRGYRLLGADGGVFDFGVAPAKSGDDATNATGYLR